MKTHENNIKWAIYARKSSDSEDRQIQSIDDQESVMRKVALREGLEVSVVIKDAKSAKIRNNRPGFTQLLKMVQNGQINGILVWKTDRLSRNPVESGFIMEALQLGQIKCIKTSDRSHYPDDNALIFAIEQSMANQYSRDLAKNVIRGMESKAQKGWFPVMAPIGYLNLKSEYKGLGTIISDPERLQLVRRMWDLMLSGEYTVPMILRIATEQWGLRTPKRKRSGGKPLATSYMYKLFTNLFYTGNFMYKGKFYHGNHEAIITMEEFDRVQIMLGKKSKPRGQKHQFAYTGLLKCGFCGGAITATVKHKFVKSANSIQSYTYYHCTRKKKHFTCCEKPVTSNELESQIQSYLENYHISAEFFNMGIQLLDKIHSENASQSTSIHECQRKHLEEIEKKLSRLLTFAVNGTISEEQYNKEKQQLEVELEKQKIRIQEIKNPDNVTLARHAFYFMHNALDKFKTGNSRQKRRILHVLGSNQKLSDKKLLISKHPWLTRVKTIEQFLLKEFKRLELSKFVDIQSYKELYDLLFPMLSALVDEVRTEYENLEEEEIENLIPDLSEVPIQYDLAA